MMIRLNSILPVIFYLGILVGCNSVSENFVRGIATDGLTTATSAVAFSAASQSINETAGTGTITVTLSAASTSVVTVPFTVSSSNAILAVNYILFDGSVTFAVGQTSKTISFTVINDSIVDTSKSFLVTLGSPVGASLGFPMTHLVTMLDINSPPVVALVDPNTLSTSQTNQASPNLSITNDTGITQWCVLEQSGVAAAPAIPIAANACWVGVRPTTQALGGFGVRKVYVYFQNAAGVISQTAVVASINRTGLGSFSISGITGGSDVTADAWLNGNSANPTISWGASAGATSYDVTIYEYDGTTIKCATVNQAGTTKTFGACNLVAQTSYKAAVIAKDGAGGLQSATNGPFIFTYSDVGFSQNYSVYKAGTIPGTVDNSDAGAIEVGMKFKSDLAGYVTGVRFYKGASNTGVHTGTLWTGLGVQLATVTFAGETAGGWQQQLFATPVAISANTTYVISYHLPFGHYSSDNYAFQTEITNVPLRGLADGADGLNGLYDYGARAFPTSSFHSTSYYVDVVFQPQTGAPSPFNITGITGGLDTLIDDQLQDTVTAVLHWTDSTGESSYDITIYDDDGVTVRCATVNAPADTTQYSLGACTLPPAAYYKAKVVAKDSAGNSTTATNSLFRFYAGAVGALTVVPTYPIHSAWNSYVQKANGGTTSYDQPDVDCSTSYAYDYRSCLHAGLIRNAYLVGVANCNGIVATDTLGVFQWSCDESLGAPIIRLTGLKDNKGLGDLLSAVPGWKSNVLQVRQNGALISQSASTTWWSNPIVNVPVGAGIQNLTASGSIYVYSADMSAAGYYIQNRNIGLVGLNGATLRYDGSAALSCNQIGSSGAPDARCLLYSDQPFIWVEGNFRGDNAPQSAQRVITTISQFGVFRNINISNVSGAGSPAGIFIASPAKSKFEYIRVANGTGTGIWCDYCNLSMIRNINVSDMPTGLFVSFAGEFSNLVISNTSSAAIDSIGVGANFTHVTTANTAGFGGFRFSNTNNSVVQWAGAENIRFEASSASNIVMYSKMGQITDLVAPGNNQYSDHVTVNPGFGNSFIGKIAVDDTSNTSDTNGVAAYSVGMDWFNFNSFFRSFGLAGASVFPNAALLGPCTAGNCQIWDWRLRAADTVLFNRSGDGVAVNGAFVPGAACPAAVDGNLTYTDQFGTQFLINAQEISGDEIGNDNGLCESGEACIYSPNIGAYQGEGSYQAAGTCIFHDGVVTGVKMYAYPTNGF